MLAGAIRRKASTAADGAAVSGNPVLIDLLTNKAGTFVVSRIPLRDEADRVIGAIGIVLFDHPETTLQPLISKFALLQRDLDDARRELASQRNRSLAAAGDGERRAGDRVDRGALTVHDAVHRRSRKFDGRIVDTEIMAGSGNRTLDRRAEAAVAGRRLR